MLLEILVRPKYLKYLKKLEYLHLTIREHDENQG